MKEYPGWRTTPEQQFLGCRMSSARMTIACSFGRLKGQFGALKRPMDIQLSELPMVIYSCFVLHNFCEIEKEPISDDRYQQAIDYDR